MLIREYRERKGVTQEELAEALGVGVTFISAVELGRKTLPLKHVKPFLHFLRPTSSEACEFMKELVDKTDELHIKRSDVPESLYLLIARTLMFGKRK